MAITATHYELFKSLPLPRGGSLLEIGEANWYGDVDPQMLYVDCSQYHPTGQESSSDLPAVIKSGNLFAIAKAFYAATFDPERIVSIDINGTAAALRVDLNDGHAVSEAIRDGDFDVIINHGTAEHVFNIAQVFRTMHDACEVGGLMVHDAPFTGWIDHGFYCLHPTLFYDLAQANCYEVVKVAMHEWRSRTIIPVEGRGHVAKLAKAGAIPKNSMLFVALRKLYDTPFRVPMQGVYAGTIGEAGERAWEELR